MCVFDCLHVSYVLHVISHFTLLASSSGAIGKVQCFCVCCVTQLCVSHSCVLLKFSGVFKWFVESRWGETQCNSEASQQRQMVFLYICSFLFTMCRYLQTYCVFMAVNKDGAAHLAPVRVMHQDKVNLALINKSVAHKVAPTVIQHTHTHAAAWSLKQQRASGETVSSHLNINL